MSWEPKPGEIVYVVGGGGKEVAMNFHSYLPSGGPLNERMCQLSTLSDGQTKAYGRSLVLREKGPFFDIRGLVFTTDRDRVDQEGEIIKLGIGTPHAGSRSFYKVRFAPRTSETQLPTDIWYREDEVFIPETP